jgi:hypothetical protein
MVKTDRKLTRVTAELDDFLDQITRFATEVTSERF